MYTLFVLKKDKSGVQYCARKGRAVTSRDRGLGLLNKSKAGVLLDTSNMSAVGLSHLDTFLKNGAKPVAAKGMPALQAAIALAS